MVKSGVNLILLCFLTVGASSLFAQELSWELRPNFRYKDLYRNCAHAGFTFHPLYFSAEIHHGNIVKAAFQSRAIAHGELKVAELAEQELTGIELHTDSLGNIWLKTLPLSQRLLFWVFTNLPNTNGLECKLREPLETISPARYAFSFEPMGLGQSLFSSKSDRAYFRGRRRDLSYYEAALRFSQSRQNGLK